jgi:serine/threonine protein kinase
MALPNGSRVGVFEIVAAIGAGGMGEVYRAKDTKLGRDVALKILPASFTNDPERVARFRREAQVWSANNRSRPIFAVLPIAWPAPDSIGRHSRVGSVRSCSDLSGLCLEPSFTSVAISSY